MSNLFSYRKATAARPVMLSAVYLLVFSFSAFGVLKNAGEKRQSLVGSYFFYLLSDRESVRSDVFVSLPELIELKNLRYQPFAASLPDSADELSAFAPPTSPAGSSIILDEPTHQLRGTASTAAPEFSPLGSFPCSVSATMTGPGVNVSGSDSRSNCYEGSARVTLIATTFQPNAEYCIHASHTNHARSYTSMACLTTPNTPRVTNVEYERILTDDLEIDANPNAQGGKRIFPDKKIPTETVESSKNQS